MRNDDVYGWRAAGRIAGMHPSRLRRMVARGELSTQRTDDGRHTFARSELEALRLGETERAEAQALGVGRETYAAILADLDAGASPADIARERNLFASEVAVVRDDWMSLRCVPHQSELDARVAALTDEVARLRSLLDENPLTSLRSTFHCEACARAGCVAVEVTCTACDHRDALGWFPNESR